LNQKVDVNVLNEYENTSLQLSFKQNYFDLKISNFIVRMLIVAKTNINETYNKTYNETSLLCFQILEIEAHKFFDDHYKKKKKLSFNVCYKIKSMLTKLH